MDIGAGERDPESEEISTGLVPPRPPSSSSSSASYSCALLRLPLRASAPPSSSCPTSSVARTSKNNADRTGTYRLAMSWASSG